MAKELLLILCSFSLALAQVTTQTPSGVLYTGYHVDYGSNATNLWHGSADVFLGIPYAQPPIGDLRFKVPQPLSLSPNTTINAQTFQAACVQPDYDKCPNQAEDCLYLNVFTPNVASIYKYPVMFWIHGGAFTLGCASQFGVQGIVRNLVSRGVVVVTIQYRLNIPGFFSTNTPDFPANRGMLDQVAALTWVKDNIAAFGGNPYSITIFGQSAGAISVSAHSYSPFSKGLFQKAIMQSGALFTSLEGQLGTLDLSKERSSQLCNFTVDQWNSGDYAPLKTCMAQLSPNAWRNLDKNTLFGWRLLLDGHFLPNTTNDLGTPQTIVPTMVGNMRDEFAFTWYMQMQTNNVPFDLFTKQFAMSSFKVWGSFYGDRWSDIWNIILKSYIPPNTDDKNAKIWWIQSSSFFTAIGYVQYMILEAIKNIFAGNKNLYIYEQTYGSRISGSTVADQVTAQLGGYRPVPHSHELKFIFMFEEEWNNAVNTGLVTSFDYNLADWYGETWTNFAKFGVPRVDGSWTPTSDFKLSHYVIDNGQLQMQTGYRDLDKIVFVDVVTKLLETPLPALASGIFQEDLREKILQAMTAALKK